MADHRSEQPGSWEPHALRCPKCGKFVRNAVHTSEKLPKDFFCSTCLYGETPEMRQNQRRIWEGKLQIKAEEELPATVCPKCRNEMFLDKNGTNQTPRICMSCEYEDIREISFGKAGKLVFNFFKKI